MTPGDESDLGGYREHSNAIGNGLRNTNRIRHYYKHCNLVQTRDADSAQFWGGDAKAGSLEQR